MMNWEGRVVDCGRKAYGINSSTFSVAGMLAGGTNRVNCFKKLDK
jgi:hypothetical protein